jgi:hypothetical protein
MASFAIYCLRRNARIHSTPHASQATAR